MSHTWVELGDSRVKGSRKMQGWGFCSERGFPVGDSEEGIVPWEGGALPSLCLGGRLFFCVCFENVVNRI